MRCAFDSNRWLQTDCKRRELCVAGVPQRVAHRPSRSTATLLHDMTVAVKGECRRVVPRPFLNHLHIVAPLEEERDIEVLQVVRADFGDTGLNE